jgi:hypothetical protein
MHVPAVRRADGHALLLHAPERVTKPSRLLIEA